jgi:hypothetical protein
MCPRVPAVRACVRALAVHTTPQVNAFNSAAVQGLMCRDTLSVSWDGRLFDCDFNQQLALALAPSAAAAPVTQPAGGAGGDSGGAATRTKNGSSPGEQQQQQQQEEGGGTRASGPLTVWDIASLDDLSGRPVRIGSHCYGCTAGSGSGCQGATA